MIYRLPLSMTFNNHWPKRLRNYLVVYLGNDTRQGHSHCRMSKGTRMQSMQWCNFERAWNYRNYIRVM